MAKWREQIKQAPKLSERFGMRGTQLSKKLRISDKTNEELFGPIRRALRGGAQEQRPKAKRKRGGGRPPDLTPEQIELGLRELRKRPKLPLKQAYPLLRELLQTDTSDTTLWRSIVHEARRNPRA
ncbi:hypothetical protein IVB18_34710 [Bradyrhizobium sp. 186]|uniref:hypothetical protein n=1 Tax=Bradyrhizobium sp. 186 TaxID=2782654 RepID=UPI002001189B|nr:hypothetical protein [Bradyrhizobium sp. 186]UPK33336.1 hypothetical protein IVB18_34710 [Bradyrhizobium sp. 186]